MVADWRSQPIASRAGDDRGSRRCAVFVSAASIWEIAIKAAKGKLRLPPGAEGRIRDEMSGAGFVELPVTWDHAFAVGELRNHHLDPFDRLLIVQCQMEGLTILTNDRVLRSYQIDSLW
jgi:PIN domain nuclease of toxin-antitoxin system